MSTTSYLKQFTQDVLTSEGTILVSFKAPWCGPCKSLTTILEELSDEGFDVYTVNIDHDSELTAKYGVRGVPTTIIFKDGKEVERLVGLKTKDELITKLS